MRASPLYFFSNGDQGLIEEISNMFNFNLQPLEGRFTYLGFKLKPVNYTNVDWQWRLDKVRKRIGS